MKKTTIIIITLAMIIVIVAPFLIVLLPEIKTSYKDIVLNWSDVGEILDKFVQIMSAALIPILIFYFGRQDANRKDLELKIRQQTEELRKFIDEYLMPEVKNLADRISEDKIDKFNSYIYSSFIQLSDNSQGLFYEKNLELILNKTVIYFDIVLNFEDYSSNVKLRISMLFSTMSEYLYNSLTNEIVLKKLINQIDNYRNDLEKILTPKEIEKLKNKLEEYQKESDKVLEEQEKSE